MKINGLQKLTLLDYPEKTACTVFLAGCNLRCPFCHNSRLVEFEEVEELDDSVLFSYLEKRGGLLDGVCITGGEPLLRKEFPSLLERIKALGFDVKLDTNGTLPSALEEVIKQGLVDYVAMDIKNSPEKYPLTVGVPDFDISPILKSVELLKSSGVKHEFRTTLIKGFHEKEDIEKIGQWLGKSERWFLQKFVDSGEILSPGLEALPDEISQNYLKIACKYVAFAQLRGV